MIYKVVFCLRELNLEIFFLPIWMLNSKNGIQLIYANNTADQTMGGKIITHTFYAFYSLRFNFFLAYK